MPKRYFVLDPDKSPKSVTIRLHCPSTRERHDNEINAWLRLSGYNHRTGKSSADPDVGRRVLRSSIRGEKPSPSSTKRGTPLYNAHHIVPLRDALGPGPGYEAYRLVVPAAFRCGVFPNSASKGVWLRSNEAPNPSGPYHEIPDANDRRRDWHGFTQKKFLPGYYEALRDSLVGRRVIDSRSGACLRGGAAFRDALGDIKQAMLRGGYIFANHRESFG